MIIQRSMQRNTSTQRLRNSKGANKPFRSPFSTPKNDNVNNNENTPESNVNKTTLRATSSKRLLFQQPPPAKKLRLSEDLVQNDSIIEHTDLDHNDLEAMRKRIQDKQECIANLKRSLLYKRKVIMNINFPVAL